MKENNSSYILKLPPTGFAGSISMKGSVNRMFTRQDRGNPSPRTLDYFWATQISRWDHVEPASFDFRCAPPTAPRRKRSDPPTSAEGSRTRFKTRHRDIISISPQCAEGLFRCFPSSNEDTKTPTSMRRCKGEARRPPTIPREENVRLC